MDGGMFFSSHTNIYSIKNGQISTFTGVDGTIRCFSISEPRAIICTDERIFMNCAESVVGSLSRGATAIDSTDKIFAIGTGNVLEVWEIPSEYKFIQFKRLYKGVGHSQPIVSIKILDESRIITASEDGTVRIFDWKANTTHILMKSRSIPTGVYFNGKDVSVVSMDGLLTFFREDRESIDEESRIDLESEVICSSADSAMLAVLCPLHSKAAKSAPEPDHFHESSKSPTTEEPASSTLIIFKGHEEILRVKVEKQVSEISLSGRFVAMRGPDFVGMYSISAGLFSFTVDLPKIVNFSISPRNLVIASCSDRHVRVYSNYLSISDLFDKNSVGDILDAYATDNSCIAVYRTGYISLFNMNQGCCYRSFSASEPDLVDEYSFSCINTEGDVLFLAKGARIYVVDLKRSKLIDEIKADAPLVALKFWRNYLYFADLASQISKVNPFTGATSCIKLEHVPTSLSIFSSSIAVSIGREIIIYDLDLNFEGSLSISLEGRNREELYSKPKAVEALGLNSSLIVCGGRANQIKLVSWNAASENKPWNNDVIQVLQLSRHADWENYKARLGKERDSGFKKQNFVEARRIEAVDGRFFVLSREGVQVFEPDVGLFNPIEFSTTTSPEFIEECLGQDKYAKALVASLQLGEFELIKRVIYSVKTPREVIRLVPRRYVRALLENLMCVLRTDFSNLNLIEMVKWIAIEHKVAEQAHADILKQGIQQEYSLIRDNLYILRSIERKSQ